MFVDDFHDAGLCHIKDESRSLLAPGSGIRYKHSCQFCVPRAEVILDRRRVQFHPWVSTNIGELV